MKGALAQAITFALMFVTVSCAPERSADENIGTSAGLSQKKDAEVSFTLGPPTLPPRDFDKMLSRARGGDIRAMHTLSVHYLSISEVQKAYEWLRRAGQLGDCEAINHLVDDTFDGLSPNEAPHWQNEQRRLGCDSEKK